MSYSCTPLQRPPGHYREVAVVEWTKQKIMHRLSFPPPPQKKVAVSGGSTVVI